MPCVDSCEIRPAKRLTKRKLDEVKKISYKAVEDDKLIELLKDATKQLIMKMRN